MENNQEVFDARARALTQEILATLFAKNGLPRKINSLRQASEVPIERRSEGSYSLVDHIAQMPGVAKIEILRPQTDNVPEGFSSYYERFARKEGDIVRVVLLRDFNYCESRFYIAKELLHYCLDKTDDVRIRDMARFDTVVQELITDNLDPLEGATMADRAARSGALELLIPHCWLPFLIRIHRAAMPILPWETEVISLRIAHILRVQSRLLNAHVFSHLWIRDAARK
ncbi:MAG: hypothetical protein LBU11_12365 [Zoogloeaceae bacterium]|jgi:hypothetical protein|nr:hypothetical protein [Zoogloeaceae bacterium]